MRVLVISLFALRVAEACEPFYPTDYAPPNGSVIPANAPALAVRACQFGSGAATSYQLVDESGQQVATSSAPVEGDPMQLVVTPSQLVEGSTYTLSVTDGCRNNAVSGSFSVTSTKPSPTSAGTVDVEGESPQTIFVDTNRGSCTTDVSASTRVIDFTPSDELRPWLPLTSLATTIDGKSWSATWYGAPPPAGSSQGQSFRTALQVYGRCSSWSSSDDNGLTQGNHHGELRAHLAGATTDPPAIPFDFYLSCGCDCDLAGRQASAPTWLTLALTLLLFGLRRRIRI